MTDNSVSEQAINGYATALHIIGICILVFGIIGSFILGAVCPTVAITYGGWTKESYNGAIAIGGIVGSIISGVLFLAFGEVINLLTDIRDSIKAQAKSKKEAPIQEDHSTSILKDIEDSLPDL